MSLIEALVGGALLLYGRRLFWLFVAALGFLAGLALATRYLKTTPGWVAFVVALAAGAAGALLALYLERLAVGVAGFISGAFLLHGLVALLGLNWGLPDWVPFLAGGILGAILVYAVLDWALIVLASLAGASMVTEGLSLRGTLGTVAYVLLAAAGMVFQGLQRRQRRKNR